MKNEENDSSLNGTCFSNDELKIVNCSSNNQAEHVCFDKKCDLNAFVCRKKSCKCQSEHSKCSLLLIESIINTIRAKIIPYQQFENLILQKIDKLIDELSDFREKLKIQMKNDLKLYEIPQNDQHLLNAVQKQTQEKLTGKKIYEMFTLSINEEKRLTVNDSFMNEFNKIWESLQKETNKKTANVLKILELMKQGKKFFMDEILKDSKVVTNEKQKLRLMEMFGQKIPASSKFLYRASENSFNTQSFHQKCDNIPHTLTLCETIYGKVVGGYTPLVWNKSGQQIKDESGASFIFSLSNNHKFKLDKNKIAIYQAASIGPTFGTGTPDFYITNSANTSSSYAQINQSYTNENYIQGNAQSWSNFNGNPQKTYNYTVKQWEVWELNFQK